MWDFIPAPKEERRGGAGRRGNVLVNTQGIRITKELNRSQ